MTDETIVTNAATGGQKATKAEKYSHLPWPQLREVARVYAFGAEKYDRYNWMLGYDWDLSYDSLIRHVEQFWSGEDRDSESELYHLAHAVFHCLTLMYFIENHPSLDTRPPKAEKKDNYEYPDSWRGIPVRIYSEYQDETGSDWFCDLITQPTGTKYVRVPMCEVNS